MKDFIRCLVGLFLLSGPPALGQKALFFKNIPFDSSYTILGIGQGYGKSVDSMERFWFMLTDLADIQKLNKDWALSKQVRPEIHDEPDIGIYIIRDKRLAAPMGLIYPQEKMVTPGAGRWYTFDTAKLIALHAAHPLHYHWEKKRFQTYVQYAAYGNSIVQDPKLLFFIEPSLRYEGQFTIMARRTTDDLSTIFVASDVRKELIFLTPSNTFEVGVTVNDSFNQARKDSVKVTVKCAKSLYDQYIPIGRVKGPWQPALIEIATFWRDDL
jgi:hypothetical protein